MRRKHYCIGIHVDRHKRMHVGYGTAYIPLLILDIMHPISGVYGHSGG